MKPGITVLIEQRGGEIKRPSLEALSEALRLKEKIGGQVIAGVIGKDATSVAAKLESSGADRILAVSHDGLEYYSTESYGRAASQIVRASDPGVILIAATIQGRDLAAAVAGTLDCAYAAECVALRIEDDQLLAVRPVYAGRALATVSSSTDPFLLSLRPNVFALDAPAGGSAAVETLEPDFDPASSRARVTSVTAAEKGHKDVAEADVVVAGGRGVGGPEGFAPLEELAETLDAAVGASRAVVDLGWRPHSEQVGQTGKVVSPKFYVAAGISGAIQHLAGMQTSGVIVAINKDPEAPIFKVADYGIVGDLFEVVPALSKAIKTARG
jgi:electron transfer flavoprotein alpha subunit